jgi:hypothetical protein
MAPRPTPPTDEQIQAVALPAPDEIVKARWVDVQLVFVPEQGEISYGDPIYVTGEQLAAGAHPTIPWSDDWTPDPILLAQSKLLEPTPKAGQ